MEPWKKYQGQATEQASGPWAKYQAQPSVPPQPSSKPKSPSFLESLKSMPVIDEPGTNMVPTAAAPKAISGQLAPYAPEIGAAVGSAGGPWGIPLGYMIGRQAQPLMQAYGADEPLPSGEEQAKRAVTDIPTAATIGMAGPVAGKLVSSGAEFIAPKLQQGAERLYASSIRMPLSRKWTKVRGEEQTTLIKEASRKGLEEQVPPSRYGLEKIKSVKAKTGKQIGEMVEDIGPGQDSLDDIILKGVSKAVEKAKNGEATEAEINAIKTWAEAYRKGKPQFPTGKEKQKWKTELYDRINFDKLAGKGDNLIETVRKGMAHELRLQLEAGNPALKAVNREYGAAVNLEEALERALPRMNNNAIFDLGTKVLIGRESWPLAILNKTIGHPQVKARIAFAMNKMATKMQGPKPGYIGGETETSGLPPEALPEPAMQMPGQKLLSRGELTLDEMYTPKQLGNIWHFPDISYVPPDEAPAIQAMKLMRSEQGVNKAPLPRIRKGVLIP